MSVASQMASFWPYEAEIVEIKPNGNLVVSSKILNEQQTNEIPPLFFGGNNGSGLFHHPHVGDRVLCVRVHPGRSGTTQAIKLIPVRNKEVSTKNKDFADDVVAGTSAYPKVKPGEYRLVGDSGGQLSISGNPINNTIFVGNVAGSGFHITTVGNDTLFTAIAHGVQSLSEGAKVYSGSVVRTSPGTNQRVSSSKINHQLFAYDKNTDGIKRGFWPSHEAVNFSLNNNIRNPTISEYKMVINEFSENSAFKGFDLEAAVAFDRRPQSLSSEKELRSINPRNTLYMGPHQLIEVLAGNIVTYRGDILDINYSTVRLDLGNSSKSSSANSLNQTYEKNALISRRGLGYNFQLSTGSRSDIKHQLSEKNFIFGIDKEGALKVNVPKSTSFGNINFPTSVKLYNSDGSVITRPLNKSAEERIPVTLRAADNSIVFPNTASLEKVIYSTEDSVRRSTGVRHSNEDTYFSNHAGNAGTVRVNFTKHHNMYAAAEMLIANTIKTVNSPFNNANAPFVVTGNPVGKPFELPSKNYKDDGTSDNEVNYMSTVSVLPGSPAIDTGGDTTVAGISYTDNDMPFSNSFSVDEQNAKASLLSGKKDAGGKSANINFEGAIDISVGADNYDKKSAVLDMAGSMIAWFGRDRNGRSVVVQTDGDVLMNIGGTNGSDFNKGRFDLRVNINNKGFVGDSTVDGISGAGSNTTENGPSASDYIISISENGLIIAGMNPSTPMIIRNDGDLILESTSKLVLAGNRVVIRDGNKVERDTDKSQTASDTPGANPIEGPAIIEQILKV